MMNLNKINYLKGMWRMKNFIVLIILITFCQITYALEIIHLPTQKKVELSELLKQELDGKTLVFGEYHYDKVVLKTHARLIWELVNREQLNNNFTVGWEFLEYDHQKQIDNAFSDWKSSKISDTQYLQKLFPNAKDPLINLPYLDFMSAAAKLGGQLVATNATRKVKKQLMDHGPSVLMGKDQPKHMLAGSKLYFQRFKKIMGGHVPEELLQTYFLAQYYTDNIIGTYIENFNTYATTFLIIGSFHSDYNDGVVRYLKTYSKNEIISFKIINRSKFSNQQIQDLKKQHSQFGYIADYLVIAEK